MGSYWAHCVLTCCLWTIIFPKLLLLWVFVAYIHIRHPSMLFQACLLGWGQQNLASRGSTTYASHAWFCDSAMHQRKLLLRPRRPCQGQQQQWGSRSAIHYLLREGRSKAWKTNTHWQDYIVLQVGRPAMDEELPHTEDHLWNSVWRTGPGYPAWDHHSPAAHPSEKKRSNSSLFRDSLPQLLQNTG